MNVVQQIDFIKLIKVTSFMINLGIYKFQQFFFSILHFQVRSIGTHVTQEVVQ